MTNVFRGFCSCCLWTILVFKKRKKNPNTKNSLFPYRTPEGLKLQEEKVGKKIQFSFNVCVGVEYFCSNFLTQTWVYTLERVYCCRISKRLPPNAHLTVFSVTNCRFFFSLKRCSFSTELHGGIGDASQDLLGAGRGSKLWPWSILRRKRSRQGFLCITSAHCKSTQRCSSVKCESCRCPELSSCSCKLFCISN